MKLLSTLILTGGLAAGAAAAGSTAIGHVTLRVRSEPNAYGAVDVARFLNDPAYLGSVNPRAIPAHELDSTGEAPDGFCAVLAGVAGGEILTIEARAEQAELVSGVLDELVNNLRSIEPTARTSAREALAAAEQDLERATTLFGASQQALRAFIRENGAVDPGNWLEMVAASLMGKTGQLEEDDLRLAGERALRDYLVQAISRRPEQIEESVPIPAQERAAYEANLDVLELELDGLKEKYDEVHPKVKKIKARIAALSKRFQERIQKKTIRQDPRRVGLEQDLFQVERELALGENRHQVLAQSVQRLRDEARRYSLLDSVWRELSRNHEMADQSLRQARGVHENAARIASQRLVGDWIQVIAGPQISRR